GSDCSELLDWLFDKNDGILRHEEIGQHGIHPTEQGDNDFLNTLLSGSDSVSASPLWSPSPSDSGISEDPPSDQMDSPQRPESPPNEHFFGTGPQAKAALEANISTDPNGWELGFPVGRARNTQYPSDAQRPQLLPGFPLTVKDLLLSGTPEPVLLLSFSLILVPSLKPFSDSKVSQVQSRSLQNLQASRVLHVIDPSFPTEDESDPLDQHFPEEQKLEDITNLMGKLAVKQDHSGLDSASLNSSQEDGIRHFHVDPITGHIASVTLNPHRAKRLRPHADDM
ncbi:hypothetical protein GOODEAATRI_004229, partial [Goodea atripinnis]